MHWHSIQLTILVHICYRWNPNYITSKNYGEIFLFIEYHYYISDDMEHDTLFVQHCFEFHWTHLTMHEIYPNEHLVWSNGYGAQFKLRHIWFHVATYLPF
jgi:hypothetical protein